MQRVLGFGGFFFKAKDPKALANWYADHLGVTRTPSDYGQTPWMQERGATVFQPFPLDTDMFGRPDQSFMLNFRVADLDAMVTQLRGAGIAVDVDPQTYPNGRFAQLNDPEGNPVQLWQEEMSFTPPVSHG
jgi:predicted enzyme related to lactoylglutathione lyase